MQYRDQKILNKKQCRLEKLSTGNPMMSRIADVRHENISIELQKEELEKLEKHALEGRIIPKDKKEDPGTWMINVTGKCLMFLQRCVAYKGHSVFHKYLPTVKNSGTSRRVKKKKEKDYRVNSLTTTLVTVGVLI